MNTAYTQAPKKPLSPAQLRYYRGKCQRIIRQAAMVSAVRRWEKTHCPHGHALVGENLYINPRGFRECRACRRNAKKRTGELVLSAQQVKRVVAALKGGATLKEITRGIVQKQFEPEKRICTERQFTNTLARDGKLKAIVDALAPRNRRIACGLWSKSRPRIADASLVRNGGLDAFAAINAATKHLPDFLRGDVQSAMFIAVGEGRLKLCDAAARVREFVAAHNRQFSAFVPVIGGRMQSLDQPVYDDGPTRLIDTVTQGLWG